jgi:prophage tail gpP-like protein
VTDGEFAPAVRDVTTQRPTVVAVNDATARQRFGRRDAKVTRNNISSFDEARQAARRKLRRSSEPREELRVQAASQFAHSLRPMDAVDVTIPRLNFDRETFVVAQVDRTLQSANLTTNLRLRQPPGLNT